MPNKFAEVTPRTFSPSLAPGLSDEARRAANAAFDAMSTLAYGNRQQREKL
jgi:hypothetical protein